MSEEHDAIQDVYMFRHLCDALAKSDVSLAEVMRTYGYPPFWSRPNTFESLVQIILEQQVSLASAKTTYGKLLNLVKVISPESVLTISDEAFRNSYVSRQKARYIRGLAKSIQSKRIDLNKLTYLLDDEVRNILIQEKGIGNWTIDVYLIEVLHRPDVFPIGDIAALRAIRDIYGFERHVNERGFDALVQSWQPYRTVATMLLWHQYLASRGRSEEMTATG